MKELEYIQIVWIEEGDSMPVTLGKIENVSLYEAPAESVLPMLDTPMDLLVMDTSRAGLPPALHDGLAELQPAQIACISYDLATPAQNVKRI